MESDLPLLLLASLSIGGKRKAEGSGGSSRAGHWGLREDAASPLALIAISRVVRAKDDAIVSAASQTPVAVALLALLRAAVLRVAVAGWATSLSAQSILTLFNLSGSGVASQRLYDGGISLPQLLPWARAKVLVAALLESLNAARATERGGRVGILLLTLPPVAVDAQIQKLPVVDAVPIPDVIDPGRTLGENAWMLLQARLSKPLAPAEQLRLDAALAEGLSVLQAGSADARRQLLSAPMAAALINSGASLLWGCVVETISDGDASSVGAFANALVATASTIAGAIFASAFGI